MSGHEYYLAGIKQFDEQKYEEALRNFTRALLAEPNKTAYLFAKARTNCRLEKYLEALTNFDEALLNEPRNAMIYSEKGVALLHLNRLEESLKYMNQAQEIEPDNPYRYSSRAYVRARAGDVFGALEDYEIAVRLDPKDAIALNNLGMLEMQIGYNKDAQKHFKHADSIAEEKGMNKPFEKVREDARKNIQPLSKEDAQELVNKKASRNVQTKNPAKDIQRTSQEETPKSKNTITTEVKQNSFVDYWKVILGVFVSKEGFQDFLNFVKELFGFNKKS